MSGLTLYKWPCYCDLLVASRVQHLSQNTIASAIPALALGLFEHHWDYPRTAHVTTIQVTLLWLMTDSSWFHCYNYYYLLVLWCLVLTFRLLNYCRLIDWWMIPNLLHCSLLSILHYSLLTFTKHLLGVLCLHQMLLSYYVWDKVGVWEKGVMKISSPRDISRRRKTYFSSFLLFVTIFIRLKNYFLLIIHYTCSLSMNVFFSLFFFACAICVHWTHIFTYKHIKKVKYHFDKRWAERDK